MKAKRYLQGITGGLLGCGLLAATATVAMAQEEEPWAELAVDAYSQYIWRGYAFSRDSLVIQPSMTTGWQGFSVNLWGNLDTDLYGADTSVWNETDLTLAYDHSFGPMDLSAGYIYYGLVGEDDTQEVYLAADYDTLLSPSLTVYRDIDGAPGWYVSLAIGHSLPLADNLALDLGAQAGYVYTSDYDALHDGVISAALPYTFGDYFTITPELAYSFALSSDARDELEAANDDAIGRDKANFVYGGLSLSMDF